MTMAGQRKDKPLEQRINERCERSESGCLEFQGWILNGYGRIRWKGKRIAVHRAIFELRNGPLLPDQCVCHHCDNPRCCNPDHLFAGTRADNNADKTTKGRQARGPKHGLRREGHPRHKLTESQVFEIRTSQMKQRDLADMFKVSQATISSIINNKRWKEM